MTFIEQHLHISEPAFERLMSSGLMRPNARRDLHMLQHYLADLPRYGSMQAMCNTSERFCLSEDQTRRIIYRLRRKLAHG